MSRLLTVPNFSTPVLPPDLPPDLGLPSAVTLHYARGDADHGRAVAAFSGEAGAVVDGLLELAARILPGVDLRAQTGAHPRIGALDVAPFVDLEGESALAAAERFAREFSARFGVPVRRYEGSSPSGTSLPQLRKEGGGHPAWGTTVVGARPFLIAANLDFPAELLPRVRRAMREMRARRDAGEAGLAGVRTLAFALPSREGGRGVAQASFNLTRPDLTSFDAVAALAEGLVGARAVGTELVGVIRVRDLAGARRLAVTPEQIVG